MLAYPEGYETFWMGYLVSYTDEEGHVIAEGSAGYLACTGTCDLDGIIAFCAEAYWEALINANQPLTRRMCEEN